MRKINTMKTGVCLFLLTALPYTLAAQIRHRISFEKDSLRIETKEGTDGHIYTTLGYEDYVLSDEPGMPSLPYKYLHFLVPNDPAGFTIEVTPTWGSTIQLPNMLFPVQPPAIPSTEGDLPAFVPPVTAMYASKSGYPSEQVSIVREGYYDGDKRILTVKVTPFNYTGTTNQLTFPYTLEFTIKPNNRTSNGTNWIMPIQKYGQQNSEELTTQLSFVENREDIPKILQQSAARSASTRSIIPTEKCEYLIVASAPYLASAEKLAFWKRLKGVSAEVVAIEQILRDPSIQGDLISGLYDSPGKLRWFLKSCYGARDTKYVLLVGVDIPFRYASWPNLDGKAFEAPTDLYYSDLNGNWNVDKDSFYGEQEDDQVDFAPELFVGRIPCKNVTEFNNYLYKLYCYEKNPGHGNTDYLKKAFYLHVDHLQLFNYAFEMSSAMQSSVEFTTSIVFEEKPNPMDLNTTFPSGKDVMDEMNKNYGFVYLAAHGNPSEISVLTNGIDPTTSPNWKWLDCIKSCKEQRSEHELQSPGNSIDYLTNEGFPNVVYTNSCETMPFDMWKYPKHIASMGEAFTVKGRYGAVAYLGATRPLGGIKRSFADALKQADYRVGVAEANSKIAEISYNDKLIHNLLGCPEFKMWNKSPSPALDFTVSTYSIKPGNNIQVSFNPPAACDVNVIGLFGGETYLQQKKSSMVTIPNYYFYNVPRNYVVVTSGTDRLPSIAPLYLQNEEVTGKHHIYHMNKVEVGSNLIPSRETGNLVIKSGADVLIQASESVLLNSGFEVELGASFEISITD